MKRSRPRQHIRRTRHRRVIVNRGVKRRIKKRTVLGRLFDNFARGPGLKDYRARAINKQYEEFAKNEPRREKTVRTVNNVKEMYRDSWSRGEPLGLSQEQVDKVGKLEERDALERQEMNNLAVRRKAMKDSIPESTKTNDPRIGFNKMFEE